MLGGLMRYGLYVMCKDALLNGERTSDVTSWG